MLEHGETDVSRTANVGTWLRKRNGGQKWASLAHRLKKKSSRCWAMGFLLYNDNKLKPAFHMTKKITNSFPAVNIYCVFII